MYVREIEFLKGFQWIAAVLNSDDRLLDSVCVYGTMGNRLSMHQECWFPQDFIRVPVSYQPTRGIVSVSRQRFTGIAGNSGNSSTLIEPHWGSIKVL